MIVCFYERSSLITGGWIDWVNGVSMIDGKIFIDNQSREQVNSQINNFELGELKYRVTKDNICSDYELSFSNVADDLIG